MTNRLETLIQRGTAFALAALVTAALLGGVNSLATRDIASDALLAQNSNAHRA